MKNTLFFCTRWGSEQLSWEAFFDKAAGAGYDGIEYGISREVSISELDALYELAAKWWY